MHDEAARAETLDDLAGDPGGRLPELLRYAEGAARLVVDQPPLREPALDLTRERRPRHVVGQSLDDPAHQLGLHGPHRGVAGRVGHGVLGVGQARGGAEPLPQHVVVGTGGRHGDEVHVVGADVLGPPLPHAREVLAAPHAGPGAGAGPLAEGLLEEGGVGGGVAVLDALLPHRRQLPAQVAAGHQHPQVAALEGLRGPLDHLGGRPADHLVGEHRRTVVGADLLDDAVPGAVAALEVVPAEPGVAQVEGLDEVSGPLAGVEVAVLEQQLAVAGQDVLQRGGPALGGPHVQRDGRPLTPHGTSRYRAAGPRARPAPLRPRRPWAPRGRGAPGPTPRGRRGASGPRRAARWPRAGRARRRR